MPEIEINTMIWGIFMSATTKSTDFGKVKHLFDSSQKMILIQSEGILWISTIVRNTIQQMRTTCHTTEPSSCRMQRFMSSLIRYIVFAEFMNIHDQQKSGREKIEWFTKSCKHHELDCIDGEPVVFEWKNFPKTHNTAVASGNPNDDGGEQIQLELFEDRSIFMAMYNDIAFFDPQNRLEE